MPQLALPLALAVAASLVTAAVLRFRKSPLSVFGAAGLTALLALPIIVFSTSNALFYGWTLFYILPALSGFVSVLLYTRNSPHPRWCECALAASLSVIFEGVGLLFLAQEGVICILMAAPLALGLALAGGQSAYILQRQLRNPLASTRLLLLLVLAAPVLMGAEAAVDREPPVYAVRTAVEVDAPPSVVWKNVISFSQLPPPDDWLFSTGIAYPIRAEIQGTGVGAVRYCVFSTGAFVEPIEVWNEPRLLRFAVTENPPSMHELSPWGDIHPPHIDGFMVSRRGQFLLTELPGGRTHLEGTTWYSHGLYPASYWRLWSDWIIHRIHLRVLRHVARVSEEQV
ncbi:MAG TPA: hypothetical protein VLT87_21070 [Thermoanaerobaculia bacterium]|nr:hypothetical protein [Thermoanaerobaculia bacterium]